ncbi:MAG: type VI secretion system tube protein Hcp [Azoarcus sp.]|nr:type VI secretion system tube protein Hcp [Azoarcus sp.]
MAFDAFLKIDGIPGESTDAGHQDWIEVLAYTHKIEQPASATVSSSGGATSERVNHGTFNIVHALDKATPKLAEACCTGRHIKDVTIELCRAGGDKVKYAEIRLEQVIVSAVEYSGGGDFPTETVSFSYGKIRWDYIQQRRADGTGAGHIAAGWDLTTNKTYA